MPIEKICQFCSSKYFVKPYLSSKTKYCSRKCSEDKCSSKEYLLSKIKIDKKTGCWIWQACKNECGYGCKSYKGKLSLAHRVFYEVFIGKIPKGMCVLHRCDIPSCCNPSHLFIGTRKDNNTDMVKKKRNKYLVGEKHRNSKLTEKEVLEIRRLHKEGLSYVKIGRLFNRGKTTIWHIVKRENWKHI